MDLSQIRRGAQAMERDRQMMFENQTLDEHKSESRFKVGAGPT
jgi:hypothetical protein